MDQRRTPEFGKVLWRVDEWRITFAPHATRSAKEEEMVAEIARLFYYLRLLLDPNPPNEESGWNRFSKRVRKAVSIPMFRHLRLPRQDLVIDTLLQKIMESVWNRSTTDLTRDLSDLTLTTREHLNLEWRKSKREADKGNL